MKIANKKIDIFKRKKAIAKCYVYTRETSSVILINNLDYTQFSLEVNSLLNFFLENFPEIKTLGRSFIIYVKGGGEKSQAEVILKSFAKLLINLKILNKKELLNYNRCILSSDSRYVYSKKAEGRGARTKRQKSYR